LRIDLFRMRRIPHGGSSSGERGITDPSALPLNTWSHLAGTYDGATLRLYVNGALVASQAFTGAITTSPGALRLGGNSVWGEYFRGRLDEVRIYNRPLSQAEIQVDMNTPVGGSPLPPDSTPPAVAPAAPAAGATMFSVVTISAAASDNVRIAGVRFFIDGQALGDEVTTAPYAITWDTTTTPLGGHVLAAEARDFAGKTTMSVPVPVIVAATTPALVGQWAGPFAWPIVAVHATLLPTAASDR
jgi:hypothetical protein